MLPFASLLLLLLPAVLVAEIELNINDYVVKINKNILTRIEAKNNATDELDLSNLGLRSLDKNVFDNLRNVKTLNLANNSLSSLPEFVFSNLTNLEYISLANNEISMFNNVFVGLKSIKCLNISNNSLKNLGKGWFFGLTKSCEVITRGNPLDTISIGLFENPFLREEKNSESTNVAHDAHVYKLPESDNLGKTSEGKIPSDLNEKWRPLNASLRVKIWIRNGKVMLLEVLKKDEILGNDYSEVGIDYSLGKLILRELGISAFEKGWYRLQDLPINTIDLEGNIIVEVTRELFNDLPGGLREVNLRGNRIERLEKGIIENEDLGTLDLSNNFIREIEDGALEKMNLKDCLRLDGNRLKNTRFTATLPMKLTELYLRDNEISEISPGSFSKLRKLSNLMLDGNNITIIRRKSFNDLPSLRYLTLTNNGLRKIELGAFDNLNFLRVLDLENNGLSSLDENLFDGIDILLTLKLNRNNFTKITKETMAGLPYTVHNLVLHYNGIQNLEAGSFENVPILTLSLNRNNISKIEKGSFDLPTLRHLSLNNNLLSEVNGDSFEGLKNLKTLALGENGIKNIEKGFAKYLGGLQILDLTKNPIKKLENGALYGLDKSGRSFMYVNDTPIELIQGGLFDDV